MVETLQLIKGSSTVFKLARYGSRSFKCRITHRLLIVEQLEGPYPGVAQTWQ